MKCVYELNGCFIWMIRLNGQKSDTGWINSLTNGGNTVTEIYVGLPYQRLQGHKKFPVKKRLIFDVIENAYGSRRYVFRGVFKLDANSDDDNHIWNKISDEYTF